MIESEQDINRIRKIVREIKGDMRSILNSAIRGNPFLASLIYGEPINLSYITTLESRSSQLSALDVVLANLEALLSFYKEQNSDENIIFSEKEIVKGMLMETLQIYTSYTTSEENESKIVPYIMPEDRLSADLSSIKTFIEINEILDKKGYSDVLPEIFREIIQERVQEDIEEYVSNIQSDLKAIYQDFPKTMAFYFAHLIEMEFDLDKGEQKARNLLDKLSSLNLSKASEEDPKRRLDKILQTAHSLGDIRDFELSITQSGNTVYVGFVKYSAKKPDYHDIGGYKMIKAAIKGWDPFSNDKAERLITIQGPSGVGKTSLALAKIRELENKYDNVGMIYISNVDDLSKINAYLDDFIKAARLANSRLENIILLVEELERSLIKDDRNVLRSLEKISNELVDYNASMIITLNYSTELPERVRRRLGVSLVMDYPSKREILDIVRVLSRRYNIKLPREFVLELSDKPVTGAIIENIIKKARTFGYYEIANTRRRVDLLRFYLSQELKLRADGGYIRNDYLDYHGELV